MNQSTDETDVNINQSADETTVNIMSAGERTVNFAKIHKKGSYTPETPLKIGDRVITIAYRLYPERKKRNVEYAASIFRKDGEKEVYNRKSHIKTAHGRLEVRPLVTTFNFDEEMSDNILESFVPKTREERKSWSKTAEGERWKEVRNKIYETMSNFLRKEVAKSGVRNKMRKPTPTTRFEVSNENAYRSTR